MKGKFLRLVRSGNTITATISEDGVQWVSPGSPVTFTSVPTSVEVSLVAAAVTANPATPVSGTFGALVARPLTATEVIPGSALTPNAADPADTGDKTIPDAWQLANGMDPTQRFGINGPYSDTDGDGIPAWQEFAFGFSPQEADSLNGVYQANSMGLLSTVTSPAHTVTNTWESTRDVLARKQNAVGAAVISAYDYSVNPLGQRTEVAKTGSAFASTRSITWGYDSLGQVVRADSTAGFNRIYEYDGIGNRKKAADSLTLPGSDNYTANALNQYTAVDAINPAYDLDGNATAYPVPADLSANSVLGWDAENRLISATVNGTTTTYLYDSGSRRIAQTTGSSTTVYIYDAWNPIAEYAGSTLAKSYTWGLDLSGSLQGAGGVGGLLAVTEASTSHFPTYDGNGNISEYLDSTGAAAAHYEYDPFGRTTVASGTLANNFAHRFSTKPIDYPTGLYYYGYRFYDPATGRWPSKDPLEEKGGVNLYAFINNNGVNSWDYLGYCDKLLNAWDKFAVGLFKGAALAYLSEKAGPMVLKRLATAGVMSAADGPLPVGEIISAGLALWTAIEIASDIYAAWQNYESYKQQVLAWINDPGFDCDCLTQDEADALVMAAGDMIGALVFSHRKDISKSLREIRETALQQIKTSRGGSSDRLPISQGEAQRIQNAADRIGEPIHLVGSRAKGTASSDSDWDYVIEGMTKKQRDKIKNSLPGAPNRSDQVPRNIDFFNQPLDLKKPHITFKPKKN